DMGTLHVAPWTRPLPGCRRIVAANKLLWGKRSDDLFEARITAERVPEREQFQGAVAQHDRCLGSTQSSFQLLQCSLLLARPRCRDGEILKDAAAVVDILFHRRERDRAPAFVQRQLFPPKSSVD